MTTKVDGRMREIKDEDIQVGLVIRYVNSDGSSPPFTDCYIEAVLDDDVKVCRPHASGVERFSVRKNNLNHFRVVLLSEDEPYVITYLSSQDA